MPSQYWFLIVLWAIVTLTSTDAQFSGLSVVGRNSSSVSNLNSGVLDTRTGPTPLLSDALWCGSSAVARQNFSTGQVKFNIALTSGGACPKYGIWPDLNYQWSPGVKRTAVCTATFSRMIWMINMDTNATQLVYAPTATDNPTNSSLTACVVDFEKNTAYVVYASKIARIGMTAPGGNWSTTAISSAQTRTISGGVLDSVNNKIYWIAQAGTIYSINRNEAGSTVTVDTNIFGGGNYRSMVLDTVNKWMYLGNDIGLGFRAPLGNFKGNYQIFFVDGNIALDFIVADPSTNVTFWGTSANALYRVNYDFQPYDVLTLNCTSYSNPTCSGTAQLGIGVMANKTLQMGFRNSNNLFKINLWTCSNYSSCSSCTADAYCGWCIGTNTCAEKGACSGVYVQDSNTCPALSSIYPSTGSVYGSSLITVTGTVFENTTKLQCTFTGNPGVLSRNITYINSTTITCISPAKDSIPSTDDAITVSVTYQGSTFTQNDLQYNYYPCNGTSCSDCYSPETPECGWCLSTGTCAVAAQCGATDNFAQDTTCPQLLSLSPSQGVDAGGTTVFIKGSYFHNATLYGCYFGSNFVNATRINSTTISCVSPAASVIGNSVINVTVVYRNNTSLKYSETKLNFIYFNCGLSTSCSSCLLGQCFWCLEQSTCYGLEQTISCQDKLNKTCPALLSVSPPSDYFNLKVNVSVVGTYFTNYSGSYECQFTNSNSTMVPATRVNSTVLKCEAPGTDNSGDTTVKIYYNGHLYANNSATFFRYDCDGTDCENCATVNRPLCQWCVSDVDCISTSAFCTNSEPALSSTCPGLSSINPSQSHAKGDILAYITVAGTLPNGTAYECDFGGAVSPGNYVNLTTVSCLVPNTTTPGWVNVSLNYNGVRYSPSTLPFRYYVCSEFSGNCTECLAHLPDGCSWCLPLSCDDTALNCPLNAQTNNICPTIIDISPFYVPANSANNVTVTGGKFIASSNYTCSIKTSNGSSFVTPASWQNETSVICVLPPRSIDVVSATVLFNQYQYTDNKDSFEFYDCGYSSSGQNCSACAANPSDNCGWCLATQTCSTLQQCDPVNQSVSEWKNAQCPAISTISPNYTAVDGQASLFVYGSDFRFNVTYLCQFNTFTTTATWVNSTTLSCTAPALAATGAKSRPGWKKQSSTSVTAVPLSILYGSTLVPYTSNSFSFEYLDCTSLLPSQPLCGDCITINTDQRCAWCTVDNKCSTSNKCNQTYPVVQEDDPMYYDECPTIVNISPLVGPTSGGTLVEISGTVFFNETDFSCSFGDKSVNMTFINGTTAVCISPKYDFPTIVDLAVYFKGRRYTNNVDFQFQSLSDDNSNDPTLAIALGTVFGVLAVGGIVAAAAFAVILKRKTAKVKLDEPDFSSLAFAGALPEYEEKDSHYWDEFEKILMENRFPLVNAICDTVQITDLDLVTRAIVYVGESSGTILPITKQVVTKEVTTNDTEGMMFRTNSVAVKLITHMAKMVGLPYLWRTLALSIHELNDIGKGETLTKYDTKSVQMTSIMAPTSIEVDPSRLEDTSDAAVNQLQLMLICQKLFTAITKSADFLPLQLRDIYRHIKIEVSIKYPEFGHKAVASFLFLRLICPCILAPHVYGLLDEPPNQECQRYLILLSKILQNLASGTLPGKKEDFLQKMNDFIASNQDPLKELIDNITVQVDTKGVEPVELPKGLKLKSLEYLYDFVYTNWNAIESVLDNQNNNDNNQNIKTRMENLLDKMGPPEKKT